MLPAPRPCGGAASPAGWLSPGGITKSAPVPRFRRPKHSSFCRVIVAARARSTSLQLPILDCRLYFTGQHRKNQYFFAGPHNFFAAACAAVSASCRESSAPPSAFLSLPPLLALVGAGVPDGPLLVLSPKGYFALRRDTLLPTAAKGCKNAAKNQWFLEFLSSDCSCGAKRFRNESPLRLPSLPLTWHAERNGRPSVWAIIKSRTCRRLRQVSVRPAGRGNYNILDIRIGAGFCPALSALRLRRPHFFQQRKKWGKERRQKPMVFGIPFIRLQLRCKKVPQRIASAPTLAAADMARREQWSPSRLGDYQIAHLPPLAASVGAARWAAPPRAEHSF